MIEETAKGLDFGALRDAIEARDPEALIGFYADDAELRVVYAALPNGPAFGLKGRAQIERYLGTICDQDMTCRLQGEPVVGEGSVSFAQVCSCPSGAPVSVRTTLELAGGLIVRQTDVVERADRDEGGDR
jgi:ketosteroid isomerase-like protein